MSRQIVHWSTVSRLKTRQLWLLLHLAEHRSVLRAAEATNMTQPAASKLLAEMESMLGVKLFDRHARGVEPTWYGNALVQRARVALSEIDRACDEIDALREGRLGQVSIGTVVNPGTNLIPQAIASVKRASPDLMVSVDMDYSLPLVDRLLSGQLDLVIGRIMGPHVGADLLFEPLADEPHAAIVRAGHPLTRLPSVSHRDLAGYGWILPPPDSVLRVRLDAMFAEQALPPPRDVIQTSSLPVITSLLRNTDMLATSPPEAIAPYHQAGLLAVLPIELGVRMESFGIVRHGSRPLSPAGQRLLAAIREVAATLYGTQSTPAGRVGRGA